MGSIENGKGCADTNLSVHPLLMMSVALGFFVLTIIKKSNASAAIQRGSLSRQNVHLAASVGSA